MSGGEHDIVQNIPIDKIDNSPFQVRMEYGDITELAANIEKLGLLSPILVRPVGERFQLVHGHRRVGAYKHLNRKHIPGVVKELDDKTALIIHGSENLQRQEFSPIETARYYAECRKFFSVKEIAKQIEKSEAHVKYHLYLVNLPEDVQTKIHLGEISVGKARALAKLAIEPSVTAVTGRFKPAIPTTKYHDEIRILSLYKGLNDATSVSLAADLVKEGVSVEEAAEEARKDYVKRRSKRRSEREDLPLEEIARNLIENLPDPRELDKKIIESYPLLVKAMHERGKIPCPSCGNCRPVWECSGTPVGETQPKLQKNEES